MRFYAGLDLGQSQDPSAVCVLEAHGAEDARRYDVRYLDQFELQTPYPRIMEATVALVNRPPMQGQYELVIDQSGVGRAIFDMFVETKLQPIGVTITGGGSWHRESRRQWHVSKILLVGTVQKFLQSGRLRIGSELKHARTLQEELREFRVQITKAAHEVYEVREGKHDDVLLSVAVALFVAEHPAPRWTPVDDGAHGFPTADPFDPDLSHNPDVDAIGGWGWRRL
jgi:hypothetical protein